MSKKRIALIGLGDIAQKAYLPILANHHKVTPILVTRNQTKLAQLAEQYRINEVYLGIDQALEQNLDGVMIHSATDSHFSIALKSLKRGIATFVDKPLSCHLGECQQLVQIAKQYDTPLFVGMNRQFAPLIETLRLSKNSVVKWQKNRHCNLSGVTQTIFDDFIHVVDGLRHLAKANTIEDITNFQVNSQLVGQQLNYVKIQFSVAGNIYEGSMHRNSGFTEEVIEGFSEQQKLQIENLTSGFTAQDGHVTKLGENNWHSYLYTRGFVSMIESWLDELASNCANDKLLEQIYLSHQLCHLIDKQINADC